MTANIVIRPVTRFGKAYFEAYSLETGEKLGKATTSGPGTSWLRGQAASRKS